MIPTRSATTSRRSGTWDCSRTCRSRRSAAAGGVTLIVTIEERPTIKEVDFTGQQEVLQHADQGPPEGSEDRGPRGAPLSRCARSRRSVRRSPTTTSRTAIAAPRWTSAIEDVSKTEKKLMFVIDEGDKIKIAAIRFEGNHVFSQFNVCATRWARRRSTHGGGSSPRRAPPTARPTMTRTSRASRASTIRGATRTSSSRTRSWTSSSRTRRRRRRSRRRASGSRFPSWRGTSTSRDRSRS